MPDVNNCVLTGRLTKDAEFKVLPSGTELVTFDMANNTGFGQYAKVLFVTVNFWGKSAKNMHPYLLKGKGVAVCGEVDLHKWTSQSDGSVQKKLVVNTSKIDFLPGGSANAQNSQETQQDDVPYDDKEYQF